MVNEAARANWQSEPCPSWCVREHHDDDHRDDRYHDSETTLTPSAFALRDFDAGPGVWQVEMGEIAIVTSKHVETDTVVTFIGRDDRIGHSLTMTPETAAQLAAALTRHVASLNKSG